MTKQEQAIWEALMTARSLIEDMVGLERAGLDTGFKAGVPAKMKRENTAAFKAMGFEVPS